MPHRSQGRALTWIFAPRFCRTHDAFEHWSNCNNKRQVCGTQFFCDPACPKKLKFDSTNASDGHFTSSIARVNAQYWLLKVVLNLRSLLTLVVSWIAAPSSPSLRQKPSKRRWWLKCRKGVFRKKVNDTESTRSLLVPRCSGFSDYLVVGSAFIWLSVEPCMRGSDSFTNGEEGAMSVSICIEDGCSGWKRWHGLMEDDVPSFDGVLLQTHTAGSAAKIRIYLTKWVTKNERKVLALTTNYLASNRRKAKCR